MVILTAVLAVSKKAGKPMRKYLQGKFIDSLRLHLRAGSGGMGLPRYGGLGGKGGDIIFVAKEDKTLLSLLKQFPQKEVRSEAGNNSQPRKIFAEPGEDKYVDVPIGVRVIDEFGRILGDLDYEGTSVLVARGGAGGSADSEYLAGKGQSHFVKLDLKLIADVGFVGFPNAGKSTLLRALSRATPKVAAYPFTTVRPEVGIMTFEDHRQISLADLPGLLEGAHRNRGMGHSFLRHVERTQLLLLVADINGCQISPHHPHRTCIETILLLNKELELYKDELLNKPALLVINKLDLIEDETIFHEIKDKIKNLSETINDYPEEFHPERLIHFQDIIGVSAQNKQETATRLQYTIRQILDDAASQLQFGAHVGALT